MLLHSAEENVVLVKDVSWKREGKNILNRVSWDVKKGQHWAIVGLNGSGKTALLNIVTGYQWPSSGEVHVLGQRLGRVDLRELRKSIGWVSASLGERYQTRASDTALQVVLSGKFASIGLYSEIVTEDEDKAYHLLNGFQAGYIANQPFRTLSQGEKQKVMLARAWMADPELIILDEPCNGLDIRAREDLLSTIDQLAAVPGGPTLIYVTHHIEEITPTFTHALMMSKGHVIATGDKHTVLTNSTLEQALQLPVSVRWQNDRPWVSIGKKLSS